MNNTYFYHPDHLGSTSLVTNSYGEITQNISYIPYGEVFVEETAGGWQSPYYFNAKELDEETGLYYYGARYLDPAGVRWLSADPMFEKYVGMTPYNYCAGNPVKLVDPDGRDYNPEIDNTNKTIKLSGTYYVSENDKASAEKAVNHWNSQSGKFIYQIVNKEDKTDKTDYTVFFDLKAEEVSIKDESKKKFELTKIVQNDRSGGANAYMVLPDERLDKNKNGETMSGCLISVKESKKNECTGAHEVGHTLGLGHWGSGLMAPAEEWEGRSDEIRAGYIKEIIDYSLNGKANKKHGNTVGKGTLTDKSDSIDLKKYKSKVIKK